MKSVIVDLDGVLCDFVASFVKFVADKYGDKIDIKKIRSINVYNQEQFELCKCVDGLTSEMEDEALKEFNKSNGYRDLKPIQENIDIVNNLYGIYNIVICTSRPLCREDTEYWLRNNFVNYNELIFSNRKYEVLYHRIEKEEFKLAIEDSLYHADGLSSYMPIYMPKYLYNDDGKVRMNIFRLNPSNLREVIEKLK